MRRKRKKAILSCRKWWGKGIGHAEQRFRVLGTVLRDVDPGQVAHREQQVGMVFTQQALRFLDQVIHGLAGQRCVVVVDQRIDNVFLAEFDGPRRRSVWIRVVADVASG